jgi:hypothetical protein
MYLIIPRARLYSRHLAESTRKDLVYKPREDGLLPPSYHPGIAQINDPKFVALLLKAEAKPLPRAKPALLAVACLAGFTLFIAWAAEEVPYRPFANNCTIVKHLPSGAAANLQSHPWCLFTSWLNFSGHLKYYLPALALTCFHLKRYPPHKHRLFMALNLATACLLAVSGLGVASFWPQPARRVWDRQDFAFGEATALFFLTTLSLWGSGQARFLLAGYLPFEAWRVYHQVPEGGHPSVIALGPFAGLCYGLLSKRLM